MPKQEHVPETRTVKPNRAQRRHPEKTEEIPVSRDAETPDVKDAGPPTDRKKKTADKWNQ